MPSLVQRHGRILLSCEVRHTPSPALALGLYPRKRQTVPRVLLKRREALLMHRLLIQPLRNGLRCLILDQGNPRYRALRRHERRHDADEVKAPMGFQGIHDGGVERPLGLNYGRTLCVGRGKGVAARDRLERDRLPGVGSTMTFQNVSRRTVQTESCSLPCWSSNATAFGSL
jgi:hypothetical protein